MPQTDDPWGRQLLDSMILLIKEELHHFWQVREMMLARDIPYVKITASNYARGLRREVRSHEPVMLIDKLICGAYIEARSCERFAARRRGWTTIYRSSTCRCCARGASLSGLSGSGAEDCRRRYQRAGAPARRGGSGADPPSRGRVPLSQRCAGSGVTHDIRAR